MLSASQQMLLVLEGESPAHKAHTNNTQHTHNSHTIYRAPEDNLRELKLASLVAIPMQRD